MVDLVDLVATELSSRADPEKAAGMAAYLKTEMPFYGVQKKGRVEVYRQIQNDTRGQIGVCIRRLAVQWEECPRARRRSGCERAGRAVAAGGRGDSLPWSVAQRGWLSPSVRRRALTARTDSGLALKAGRLPGGSGGESLGLELEARG